MPFLRLHYEEDRLNGVAQYILHSTYHTGFLPFLLLVPTKVNVNATLWQIQIQHINTTGWLFFMGFDVFIRHY